SMISVITYYSLFAFVLFIYIAEICPFMEDLGYLRVAIHTLGPILPALSLRLYLFRKNIRNLQKFGLTQSRRLFSLPRREFRADVLIWLLLGLGLAALYTFYLKVPVITGAKILLGCMCFGIFGGMLCFLSMEKRTMILLEEIGARIEPSQKGLFSVSKKMLVFMVTVLIFMVLAILVMVFMNIHYVLAHGYRPGPDMYYAIFREVIFAFAVLLFFSLLILRRYSKNLQMILALQLGVMEEIGQGNYETRAPVVSNDEFGLIAAKTNEMITGLMERDVCQISFGRYMTPEVSQRILKGDVPQEGELREVTILFCDLRGYTSFVEEREPKDVVAFLNEYFSEMERTIKNHKGIVLQYIGDEIEAVFGAPEDLPDHPEMAVSAALEMRKRLAELNRKREAKGKSPIAHGIGIHTGTVLAGSVGSPDRLVYAMVGDTVNSASRIQNLNKTYGTDILISERTRDLIMGKRFDLASLGRTALRGKSQEMEILKVL
ncbi:MAG: adenylate/guanylate cyclase domain-containing protein, partial [Deltaproteobacteria bacterium]|nr:adenylate/guanylate cyclase domain-containing protein [Deltaproteobacteria bacterium]